MKGHLLSTDYETCASALNISISAPSFSIKSKWMRNRNKTTYFLWSNKMEVYLRGRGPWGCVENTAVAPAAGNAHKDFSQKGDQPNCIIILLIQHECLAPVISLREPDKV